MSDYGSFRRTEMEREMAYQEKKWRATNRRETFWDRHGDFIGGLLWCVAFAMIGGGLFLVYGLYLPR